MSPFVLSKQQKAKGNLLYDLFAVSNHYGSVGFGHYTAFGKNYQSGEWLNFDDSSCSPIVMDSNGRSKEIVSNAAYSLFYRLRDESTNDSSDVSFESLKQQPDAAFLKRIKDHEEAN